MEKQKNRTIYQHFRKDEQTFIDWVEERVEECANQYRPIVTNFLNPRQRVIVDAIVGQYDDISVQYQGGFQTSEQQRALIYPDYYTPSVDDFDICLCQIQYPVKFAELSHSSILGSIMGLGIERSLIGDITTDETIWQFVTSKMMFPYLQRELTKIGKIKISIEQVPLEQLVTATVDWEMQQLTLSSLRVDTVISGVFGISRQRAKEIVEKEQVKLNWAIIHRPDTEVETQDILSIRGFGRVMIQSIGDRTRKNKLRVEVGTLKNKR